jgi:hypothetical protein
MPSARTIDAILSDLQLPTRSFPLSFTEAFTTDTHGIRVGLPTSKPQRLPDVTAIILNWSRLDNVIRIASLLCGQWLDDTIAEVYVWNNSPQKLSKEVCNRSVPTSDARGKLRLTLQLDFLWGSL